MTRLFGHDRDHVPLSEQGLSWAEWDAAEEAADKALPPRCDCWRYGEYWPDYCEKHRDRDGAG